MVARTHLGRAWSRVAGYAPSLLLAATAAGLAYLIASQVFGTQEAVFAPIAAVVATGLSAGQRARRAVEISGGVVIGLIAADLLSRWIGIGPLQLAVAVLLAMVAAVLVRPSGLMANQAAVAAVVVMALVPFLDTGPWVRLGDAVVGGAVAVVLNAVLAPDPYRAARTAAAEALRQYSSVLETLAEAVRAQSLECSERALEDMTALDGASQGIADAVAATRERVLPARAEDRRRLRAVQQVGQRSVVMVSSGRALCRAGANLIRHGQVPDARLPMALDELAAAVTTLRRWVTGQAEVPAVRECALRAASTASACLRDRPTPTTSVLVGQVRSAALDVLRATGLGQDAAVRALEEAAGRADPV